MFKDYYNYKKRNKRIRWIYNRENSVWKRESPNTYANHTLSAFIRSIMFLTALCIGLFWLTVNMPFTKDFPYALFNDFLVTIIWAFFIVGLIVIGYFVKKFWRAFMYITILSIITFFSSDVRLLEYNTPFYIYFVFAMLYALVFSLIAKILHFLTNRHTPSKWV